MEKALGEIKEVVSQWEEGLIPAQEAFDKVAHEIVKVSGRRKKFHAVTGDSALEECWAFDHKEAFYVLWAKLEVGARKKLEAWKRAGCQTLATEDL